MSSCESDGSDGFTEADDDVEDALKFDGSGGFLCDVLEGGGEEGVSGEDSDVFTVNDLLAYVCEKIV